MTTPFPDPRQELRHLLESGLVDGERPISQVYPVIDTDLGRDNVENDLPAADLSDL